MVNLTTTEARLLYDWLKRSSTPNAWYADYMRIMEKLDPEKHPKTKENPDGR